MRLCSADTDNEFQALTLQLRNIASELRTELEGSEPLVSGGGGNSLFRAAQQGWAGLVEVVGTWCAKQNSKGREVSDGDTKEDEARRRGGRLCEYADGDEVEVVVKLLSDHLHRAAS